MCSIVVQHGICMKQMIQEVLRIGSKQLQQTLQLESTSARLEAQCLLQAGLQVNRAYLFAHPEQQLNDEQYTQYQALLARRLNGEPVAYILGEREFYGLMFNVTPDTLIPRPETELLVELALQRIPLQEKFRMLDMGTGSGAIALSIACARPDAEIVAVDISEAALRVAHANAHSLHAGNVRLLRSDWFNALLGEYFSLIVANPPYIAADDVHLAHGDVRFEPAIALASGVDGLRDIRYILTHAHAHLNAGGWLLFEHGYDQAEPVRELLRQAGFGDVFSASDLAGIARVSGGRLGV